MTPLILSTHENLAILNAMVALASFVGAKLHLSSTTLVAPSPNFPLASFVEAIFTGYAAQVVTYGTAFIDVDGNPYLLTNVSTFTDTAVTVGDTVNSWYLTDGAGTNLLAFGNIDGGPIGMNAPPDAINMVLKFALDPTLAVQITL